MNQLSNTDPGLIRQLIVSKSEELGFDDIGFSNADFLGEHAEHTERWLANGFQGSMHYLEKNREKRYDPRLLVENTKTVVTVLQNYFPEEKLSEADNYKIAKYAYGVDYHTLIRSKMNQILKAVEETYGSFQARVFTDSAPVLDRAWAEKCGLGFIGKNTCLIHPRKGSFFFIGHIFLPFTLEADTNQVTDYCGTCRRCIDACPTQALVAPHQLDARKCISYLTIEHRGELPTEMRNRFNGWIFGCDICQDVCPWNRFAKPHWEPLFALSPALKSMRKNDWHSLDKAKYKLLFKDSAVERTKFEGLKRNIDFIANIEKDINH